MPSKLLCMLLLCKLLLVRARVATRSSCSGACSSFVCCASCLATLVSSSCVSSCLGLRGLLLVLVLVVLIRALVLPARTSYSLLLLPPPLIRWLLRGCEATGAARLLAAVAGGCWLESVLVGERVGWRACWCDCFGSLMLLL